MSFSTKVIKKKKSEETETDLMKAMKEIPSSSESVGKLTRSVIPPESIGGLLSKESKSEPKKPKSDDAVKLDALISAAAKKKVPVKMEVEQEEKEEDMEKKPTKFIPHGGNMLQYLEPKDPEARKKYVEKIKSKKGM
jgi:hypothetical protein